MKTWRSIALFIPFTPSYAALLGLGFECLLCVMSLAMGAAIDADVVSQYPRFLPFCMTAGTFALLALIALIILNFVLRDKLQLNKPVWGVQAVCALMLSLPMLKAWEMIFAYLRQAF